MQTNELLKNYDQWHKTMSAHEQHNVLALPWYKTVEGLLPDLNNKRVLEVGCGRGVFSHHLATSFPTASITAVDFSESAINIAKDNFQRENLEFQVENAESLSFSNDEFDYYISCETLEHVLHPQQMIHEIRRVLKKNGIFIITTENYFNAYVLVWLQCWITRKPFESGCGVQPHENFFIFPMIVRMLNKAGLLTTHTESNYYQWLVLPRVSPLRLCTKDFKAGFLKLLFKPFGRHFTYVGRKR